MTDKATDSAQVGKQAATDVAQTAAEHANQVATEAQRQARNLLGEARDQLRGQVGDQQRNAVTRLRSWGDELRSMANGSQHDGLANDLVGQAGDRAHAVADWLNGRRPEDLLEDLRRFARRRPGAFVFGALAGGLVAGRLTRGVVAAHSDDTGAAALPPATPAVGADAASGTGGSYGGAPGGGVGGDSTQPLRGSSGVEYGSGPAVIFGDAAAGGVG